MIQLEPDKARTAATYSSAADHFDAPPLAFWARVGERTIDRIPLHDLCNRHQADQGLRRGRPRLTQEVAD